VGLWQTIKSDAARYNRGNDGWPNLVWTGLFELGFQATLLYRVRAVVAPVPVVGGACEKILRYIAAVWTGTEISPRAQIAGGLHLPHPHGVVISGGVKIGSGVDIYQDVTLGRVRGETAGAATVGNGARFYAGAKVLGDVSIGKDAIIGANAVVLKDVPAGASAVGVPARIVRVLKSKRD